MPTDSPDVEVRPTSGIDRIVHEPARLSLLAQLYCAASADFLYLSNQTGLTKGNLSEHLRKLEVAGYVSVEKTLVDGLPLTVFRLTDEGHEAIETYRKQVLDVLGAFDS
jgi:DNA-binding MarR family transcriptional regulator